MEKNDIQLLVPAVRMVLSSDKLLTVKFIEDKSLKGFQSEGTAITVENADDVNTIINTIKKKFAEGGNKIPSAIAVTGVGVLLIGNNPSQVSLLKNKLKAGESLKMEGEITSQGGKVDGKIMIVTGGAQGFGAGIVESLMENGANVVIADLNEEKGSEFAASLNEKSDKNKALFVRADVSNATSVENLVYQTVVEFGGLDVFISNAGILRAGGLDEMTPETFELMTKVNYSAYFLCAKYASVVMKIQHQFKPDHFMDIIQINSKSGLKGSNRNFAYAGGKFGGIGLTQSFALELMPSKIKVNSICPGNFFDGPLWADPENGLFVQYLRAGKVPGAKTIEDVKRFYEGQVPAGRGCTPIDVMRAVYYVIEQEYETGQAIPVTGGQNMLS